MKTALKGVLLCLLSVGVLFSAQADASAFFEASVSPRRGGQHIRFEASRPGGLLQNEEVAVTVDTDEGVPYRIYLNTYQPLTNEFGKTIPQTNFFLFSPSNPVGTLRSQLETPITLGQMPIYTSTGSGDSDSFILVFNVNVPEGQDGGTYRTQLSFVFEPLQGGGFAPVIRNLDVRVELRPTFSVEMSSQRGGRQIDLGRIDRTRPVGQDILTVVITSNIGSEYRMIQQRVEPLVSLEGMPLRDEALRVQGSGGSNGSLTMGADPAEAGPAPLEIYRSGPGGESDALQLQYTLEPSAVEKAGSYSGMIAFRFDSDSPLVSPEVLRVPVRVDIEPIFDLEIEIREGLGIHFGVVKPGEEGQERQVSLTVRSNLGEAYNVSQVVSRRMMLDDGTVLPDEAFVFFGERTPTGQVSHLSPSSVREGETVVFTSDNAGTPENIVLNYRLAIPANSKAGSYGSEIKYSITTL